MYFAIIAFLSIIFTLIDYLIIVKQRKIMEPKEEEKDFDIDTDIDVHYNIVGGYKVFLHISFLFFHAVILLMCMIAWVVD